VWPGLLAGLLVAVGLALVTRAARRRFAVVLIRGPSMQPALQPGDRALVRRGGRPLLAGDVVVFHEPPLLAGPDPTVSAVPSETWVVKRVVALAGDRVPPAVAESAAGELHVPPGALVVLGDNRPMSRDSRHWGFIPEQAVLGRAVRTLSAGGGQVLPVTEEDLAASSPGRPQGSRATPAELMLRARGRADRERNSWPGAGAGHHDRPVR
jgi:signal peptidase I